MSSPAATDTAKIYACSECSSRSPSAGDCTCGGGPRVDLADPQAIEMLVEFDDRAQERAKQRNLWVGVITGVGSIGALLVFYPDVLLAVPLPIPFGTPIKIIGLMILVALLAQKAIEVVLPTRRKFPELLAAPSRSQEALRAAQKMKSQRVPLAAFGAIGALFLLGGVASKVLKDRKNADDAKTGQAWRDEAGYGADDLPDDPSRSEGLRDGDLPILMASVPTLIGKVELTGSVGLLYRVGEKKLVACQVKPGGDATVTCHDIDAPIRHNSARFVEGQTELTVYGVTEMGNTPEETKYGAFRAFSGEPVPGDATTLALAPDRPRLDPASDAWYRGSLGGTQIVLRRDAKQNLVLEREGTTTIVLRSPDRDGPKTGSPLIFHHDDGLVAVFQTGHGLAALLVKPSGEAIALEPTL